MAEQYVSVNTRYTETDVTDLALTDRSAVTDVTDVTDVVMV